MYYSQFVQISLGSLDRAVILDLRSPSRIENDIGDIEVHGDGGPGSMFEDLLGFVRATDPRPVQLVVYDHHAGTL